ncbi:MAG TPA: 2-dehydropantoate 2-reductase [Burkholderiales bacterium]|nr:2-dehydropantoate 2-reductase [Burkholderiales bacterium]
MKIAVMGAGAVGCYYGGMLARAGHEVTLIGRAQHVKAVQQAGLQLETKEFQEHVAMHASTTADGVRGAQLVLFCVKSIDTENAGADMAPHLDAGALVLSLQNGVDNAVRLQRLVRARVAPAVVYVASEMAGAGHVRHHGRGELVVPPEVAADELKAAFAAAGVPLETSDNVAGALWAKLILNCVYNAMSAITQLPYGRLIEGEGVKSVMRDVMDECLTVARAAGVAVPGDPWEAVLRIARTMPTQYSSTAQDLARGKKSEIDHLNGFVLRQGEALGVPTPVNRALHALVKLMESR